MIEDKETLQLIHKKWMELRLKLKEQFGKTPDMNAILMLIGIRELGKVQDKFTKEEKQDLMHIAVCKLLSSDGYYELEGLDQDGWPHWIAVKKMPVMDLQQQERLLRKKIVEYFDNL